MTADENKRWVRQGKKCLWAMLGSLISYGVIQLLNAFLIFNGIVSEENALILICISAGVSVFLSAIIGLRGERQGRLILSGIIVLGFLMVLLCGTFSRQEKFQMWGNVAWISVSAALGGMGSAMLGGGKKKRKNRRR